MRPFLPLFLLPFAHVFNNPSENRKRLHQNKICIFCCYLTLVSQIHKTEKPKHKKQKLTRKKVCKQTRKFLKTTTLKHKATLSYKKFKKQTTHKQTNNYVYLLKVLIFPRLAIDLVVECRSSGCYY